MQKLESKLTITRKINNFKNRNIYTIWTKKSQINLNYKNYKMSKITISIDNGEKDNTICNNYYSSKKCLWGKTKQSKN